MDGSAAHVDEQGRHEPPVAAGETDTLVGFLEYHRETLAWKCAGLDAAELRVTVGASSMTLGGMLRHLAFVEDWWFGRWLHGHDLQPLWSEADWDGDPDVDWRLTDDDTPERLRTLWGDAVTRSRALTARSLADGGLDTRAHRSWPDGRTPSLRWILLHLVEEYARHNGHADLIRESIDGLRGE